MKIAVEGCAHGELEKIYETIQAIEKNENTKVDLLLCCGDFQSTRNLNDLQTMAVPQKYLDICTFYKYYSGELVAPLLTIFVGGNHEASNYLQELPYGGWVAPNIYYMGYASVVCVNGVRIGGISGIYKSRDYMRGHFEYCPYVENTKRSVYHVRQLEVFRLKQLTGIIDLFMSHDWPQGIHNYGNKSQLLRFKPHFREDIEHEQLGSKPCMELLMKLQPKYWFAAHLHCKFAALVPHEVTTDNDDANDNNKVDDNEKDDDSDKNNELTNDITSTVTKFLALDKCLPRRRFLQICEIETSGFESGQDDLKFEYDLEWLTILHLTNHLLSVKQANQYMPGPSSMNERFNFTPTGEEKKQMLNKLENNLSIPRNFCRTVEAHNPSNMPKHWKSLPQPTPHINPQTITFCDLLGIDDPVSLALLINGQELNHSRDLYESIDIKNTDNEDYLNISGSENSMEENLNSTETDLENLLENPTEISEDNKKEEDTQKEIENDIEEQNAKDDQVDEAANYVTPTECDENVKEVNTSNVSEETPNKKFKRRNQDIYSEKPVDYDNL